MFTQSQQKWILNPISADGKQHLPERSWATDKDSKDTKVTNSKQESPLSLTAAIALEMQLFRYGQPLPCDLQVRRRGNILWAWLVRGSSTLREELVK